MCFVSAPCVAGYQSEMGDVEEVTEFTDPEWFDTCGIYYAGKRSFYPDIRCDRDDLRGGELLPIDYYELATGDPSKRYHDGLFHVQPTPYEASLSRHLATDKGLMMVDDKLTIPAELSAGFCSDRLPAVSYTVHVETSAIGGDGWHGLMVEQSVEWADDNLHDIAYCSANSPLYRCVSMIFGSDKATAVLPRACMFIDPDNPAASKASAIAYLLRAAGALRLDGK